MDRSERLRARQLKRWGAVLFVIALLVVGIEVHAIAAPPPQRTSFDMGFHVTTAYPTNVVVRWKVRCHKFNATTFHQGQMEAVTPITRTVLPSVENPDGCHLRVVAWDVPPWHAHYHGQRPVVTSWARPLGVEGQG